VAPAHRVLIVSEHPYPTHATLRRNVVELLDAGICVDLLCLANPSKHDAASQHRGRLRVYQMHMEHRRSGALRYLWEYVGFFFWSLPVALTLSLRNRYDAVLVDNLPDFLVFVAFIARWRGARVVLEMFELTPELTAARLSLSNGHLMLRSVRWIEKVATLWADHVIAVSQQCKDILVERGVDARKISVLPNTPAAAILTSRSTELESPKPFLVTHASLVQRYGVQVAIRALALLRRDWPDLTLRVLGEGEYKDTLIALTRELDLAQSVVFRGFLPWADAMREISQASVGIVAIIADGYGELLLPTKLLEYVEHDIPVVCANLPTIAHHFPTDSLAYFAPGDPAGLAAQADRLLRDRSEAMAQAGRARLAMQDFSWDALAPQYMAALGLRRVEMASGAAV
jgi:glycosyltransferase involved in cell wall biosynthesis